MEIDFNSLVKLEDSVIELDRQLKAFIAAADKNTKACNNNYNLLGTLGLNLNSLRRTIAEAQDRTPVRSAVPYNCAN